MAINIFLILSPSFLHLFVGIFSNVAVAILLVIVVVLAIQNLNREKRYMTQILSEKGASLIKAFEAGARTGIACTRWGGAQVQTLIEEFARQPGILYLTVTDRTGLILAHSDRRMIGQKFLEVAAEESFDVPFDFLARYFPPGGDDVRILVSERFRQCFAQG